jgi:hypothetical protein
MPHSVPLSSHARHSLLPYLGGAQLLHLLHVQNAILFFDKDLPLLRSLSSLNCVLEDTFRRSVIGHPEPIEKTGFPLKDLRE